MSARVRACGFFTPQSYTLQDVASPDLSAVHERTFVSRATLIGGTVWSAGWQRNGHLRLNGCRCLVFVLFVCFFLKCLDAPPQTPLAHTAGSLLSSCPCGFPPGCLVKISGTHKACMTPAPPTPRTPPPATSRFNIQSRPSVWMDGETAANYLDRVSSFAHGELCAFSAANFASCDAADPCP